MLEATVTRDQVLGVLARHDLPRTFASIAYGVIGPVEVGREAREARYRAVAQALKPLLKKMEADETIVCATAQKWSDQGVNIGVDPALRAYASTAQVRQRAEARADERARAVLVERHFQEYGDLVEQYLKDEPGA